MHCFSLLRRIVAALSIVMTGMVVLGTAGSAMAASSYNVVYAFCPEHNGNCSEGSIPKAGVVRDAKGNFYGTTLKGGEVGQNGAAGIVYQVTPDGVETILHTFCTTDCSDGSTPSSQLVIDTDGNLYGTTQLGGINDGGTVFKLSRGGEGKWKFSVLYRFCSKANCADGANPFVGLGYRGSESGAPYDGQSELFGVTNAGGEGIQGGVVFSLKPGGGKKFKEKVIYDFCSSSDCSDGSNPMGTPTVDAKGNLFGTLVYGGFRNAGGVYELVHSGKKYNYTLLYSFCGVGACADGHSSDGPITLDAAGNLYGTSYGGGADDGGVIFKIVPNGANSQETVLYNFCSQNDCADGAGPYGGVTMDSSGTLYGTTISGGANQRGGTIYSLKGSKLSVLHSFTDCSVDSCPQGANPMSGVTLDSAGNLFGTTQYDSINGDGGVIYEFKP